MAATSPDALYYPTDADPYNPPGDIASLASSVQTALVRRTWYFIGSIAQRNALASPDRREGVIWEDIATGAIYQRRGSSWVTKRVPGTPYAMAAGTAKPPSIGSGKVGKVTVTLPAGRFSHEPKVSLSPRSAVPNKRTVSLGTVSTKSFVIYQHNGTSGSGYAAVDWIAIQMTPGASAG